MRVLHLTLKKKWFDMIASGEKREEYRELKPYWFQRLVWYEGEKENFSIVRFRNGYSRNARQIDVECQAIFIFHGIKEWGAETGKKYFVIRLGKLLTSPSIINGGGEIK